MVCDGVTSTWAYIFSFSKQFYQSFLKHSVYITLVPVHVYLLQCTVSADIIIFRFFYFLFMLRQAKDHIFV